MRPVRSASVLLRLIQEFSNPEICPCLARPCLSEGRSKQLIFKDKPAQRSTAVRGRHRDRAVRPASFIILQKRFKE